MKISVCIPTYNNILTIHQAINSVLEQDYKEYEIIISDDCSTDGTYEMLSNYKKAKVYQNKKNLGCGKNLDELIKKATGDIIVFLCADDLFVNKTALGSISSFFIWNTLANCLGRWYYWFTHYPRKPVRVKKSKDILEVADQISGMAFRASALKGLTFSNEPFIEVASMVRRLEKYSLVLPFFTIAVRIDKNGSMNPKVYVKSPFMRWYELAGPRKWVVNNFVGLVQIKSHGGIRPLLREVCYMANYYPLNVLNPKFWFWSLLCILTPSQYLIQLTNWYKEEILSKRIANEYKKEDFKSSNPVL